MRLSAAALAFPLFAWMTVSPDIHAAEPARNIEIASPWIRAAPPIAKVGAAYFTIEVTGTADRLLGATTPAAERVEIHATIDNNGVMQMRAQPAVTVTPGRPTVLAPGGTHLMLFNLRTELAAGTRVPLVLKFERAGEVRIEVPVLRDPPPSTPAPGHH